MLTGNIVSFVFGAVFSVVVTFFTRWRMTKEEVEAEWEKTRDIDNPLTPWVQVYKVSKKIEDLLYVQELGASVLCKTKPVS